MKINSSDLLFYTIFGMGWIVIGILTILLILNPDVKLHCIPTRYGCV